MSGVESTGRNKAGQWLPGVAGGGEKHRGTTHYTTRLRQQLRKYTPAAIAKLAELVAAGDVQAIRLLLSYSVPRSRVADAEPLPTLEAARSLTEKSEAVLTALGAGQLAPEEAAHVLSALASAARVREIDELVGRIAALEQAVAERAL